MVLSLIVTTMMGQLVSAAPTTNPSERGAVLQREREHYLQTIGTLPRLDVHRMTDILQMGVEDGQLLFRSPAQPWPNFEARRIELEGRRFPASLTYSQFVANEPNSRQFELKFEDYPDADLFGQLRLQWRALPGTKSGELSIEKSEQTSSSFFRVFYFQNPGMARLLVFANDASADHNLQSFNYLERDFATLLPWPSRRGAGLAPACVTSAPTGCGLVPDINAAWQVLSARWPVPAQVTREVARLVPELDNVQSRVRNHAANQLANLGRDGATAILRFDRTGLSLQQNVRLDEVIARFRRMSPAAANRLEGSVDFLLDAEYCDDAIVRTLAAQKLRQILGNPLSLDMNSTGPGKARRD